MKNIKEYLNESLIRKQASVDIKTKIERQLQEWGIKHYNINPDMTIDVTNDEFVTIYGWNESKLPDYIQFNEVDGCFLIKESKLKTLRGCPRIVKGNFYCNFNHELENLEGGPQETGHYFVYNCKNIESLKGGPKKVYGQSRNHEGFVIHSCPKLQNFDLQMDVCWSLAVKNCDNFEGFACEQTYRANAVTLENLPKLTSIKGIPQTIYDELTIVGCKKLKSLDGIGAVTILICNKNGKRFLKKDVEDVGGTLYFDRVKLK